MHGGTGVSPPLRLPYFDDPPVSRVVLGVAFETIATLRGTHLGLFWQRLNADGTYPRIDEFSHQAPQLERFPQSDDWAGLDLSIADRVPVPRVVLSSPGRRDQVALQNDLVQSSWLRRDDPYPRFEHPRDRFVTTWRLWREFIDEVGVGEVNLLQAEVSYFNDLPVGKGWTGPNDLAQLVRVSPPPRSTGTLESYHYSDTTVVQGDLGQGRLRLVLFTDPPRRRPGRATLELTFRAPLAAEASEEDLLGCLDWGHQTIIDTFLDVTTNQAHELWGRRTQ